MTAYPGERGSSPVLDESIARVVVRPIASPLALGFLALAIGSFVLAGLELGVVSVDQSSVVALVLVALVAPLQFIAMIYGFLARDAVAATGMGILSATWATVGIIMLTQPPGAISSGKGLLLLASAVALLVPAATGFTTKAVAGLVMITAAARFALTGAYQLNGIDGVQTAAAILGFVLSGIALYAAFAFELEDSKRRTILPTLRNNMGRRAMQGDLSDELAQVRHEAGVREQL